MNNRMTGHEDEKEIKAFLKQAIAPIQNCELERDLWPQMLSRLDFQPQSLHVPWFDWALAALAGAALLFYPGALPALLFHL